MQKDEPVVTVLYHDTDSSSKHGKVNLHNLSIRCKAAGLAEDSADQYFAAGIDRTLNGGLTQCEAFSTALPYSVLTFISNDTVHSSTRMKFFSNGLKGKKWSEV